MISPYFMRKPKFDFSIFSSKYEFNVKNSFFAAHKKMSYFLPYKKFFETSWNGVYEIFTNVLGFSVRKPLSCPEISLTKLTFQLFCINSKISKTIVREWKLMSWRYFWDATISWNQFKFLKDFFIFCFKLFHAFFMLNLLRNLELRKQQKKSILSKINFDV